MKLVVGLGNPGPDYRDTRHNLGFMVVDEVARRHQIDITRERFQARVGLGQVAGEKVVLAKPTTFMNRSGRAVQAIGRFYKLELLDLLVVTDDLALPLGKLRARPRGSAGGHRGLQDIIERLGTEEVPRLRVGIEPARHGATEHVLGKFSSQEQAQIQRAVARAADAVTCWIERGMVAVMNRYNADDPGTDTDNA